MNVKFSIKDVKVKIPSLDVQVNIGEIKYEVENANVLEIAQATKELLKGVSEFKADLEESERVDRSFYHNEFDKEVSPLVSFTGFVPKNRDEDSGDSVTELDKTFETKKNKL